MEQINMSAVLRVGTGKQVNKKLRDSGMVPAVVYHRGDKTVSVSVPNKDIAKVVREHAGENVLINLSIEQDKKGKSRAVLIKEIQQHPVKRSVLHVDFNEISLTEKIIVDVEIISVGESIGVKRDGGMLDHVTRIVKVQCLPTDIPKHIEVDVTDLELNKALHVSDIRTPDNIKIVTDAETVIYQVRIHEQKAEEPAVAEQSPELEVIREKKDEAAGKDAPAPAKDAAKDAKK